MTINGANFTVTADTLCNDGSVQKYFTGGAPSGWSLGALGGFDYLVTFDGYADGAAVTDAVGYWANIGTNQYGTRASTSVTRGGRSSSAQMMIEAGTTGRRGDGSPTANGDFGFGLYLPESLHLSEGDEIWFGAWLHIPSNFNPNTTSTNTLKTMRLEFTDNGVVDPNKLETMILHRGNSSQVGWALFTEFDYGNNEDDRYRNSNRLLVPGQWNWVEAYVRLSANGNNAIHRVSINDQFAYERNGTTHKWVDATGTLQTETRTAMQTLESTSHELTGFMLFTYWNSGPVIDQTVYVDSVAFTKSAPAATDDQGNSIIGTGAL